MNPKNEKEPLIVIDSLGMFEDSKPVDRVRLEPNPSIYEKGPRRVSIAKKRAAARRPETMVGKLLSGERGPELTPQQQLEQRINRRPTLGELRRTIGE